MTTKPFYASATLQGIGVSLLGNIVTIFHLPLGNDEVQALVAAVLTLGGLVYAIYGRMTTSGHKLSAK